MKSFRKSKVRKKEGKEDDGELMVGGLVCEIDRAIALCLNFAMAKKIQKNERDVSTERREKVINQSIHKKKRKLTSARTQFPSPFDFEFDVAFCKLFTAGLTYFRKRSSRKHGKDNSYSITATLELSEVAKMAEVFSHVLVQWKESEKKERMAFTQALVNLEVSLYLLRYLIGESKMGEGEEAMLVLKKMFQKTFAPEKKESNVEFVCR